MKKIILLGLLAANWAPAEEGKQAEVSPTPTVTATATATASVSAKKAEGLWIDVRSPEEYAAGHIEGAINIPVADVVAGVEKLKLQKDAPINLYCKRGIRAQQAYEALSQAGYSNLTNQGGYQDLVAKGIK